MKYRMFFILIAALMTVSSTTSALEESAVRDYFTGWDTGDIVKVMSYF